MMLNSILTYSASSHSFSKKLHAAANGEQNRKPQPQRVKMYDEEIIWSPAATETSTAIPIPKAHGHCRKEKAGRL